MRICFWLHGRLYIGCQNWDLSKIGITMSQLTWKTCYMLYCLEHWYLNVFQAIQPILVITYLSSNGRFHCVWWTSANFKIFIIWKLCFFSFLKLCTCIAYKGITIFQYMNMKIRIISNKTTIANVMDKYLENLTKL